MAQEQLSGWFDVAIAAVGGLVTGIVGLLVAAVKFGRRDQAIDQSIAESAEELRQELHTLRLYIDEQDKLNRHDMYNFMQKEIGKFEDEVKAAEGKLLYHEQHDDKRFELTNNRIWGIELRNAARDGVLPPAPPSSHG